MDLTNIWDVTILMTKKIPEHNDPFIYDHNHVTQACKLYMCRDLTVT